MQNYETPKVAKLIDSIEHQGIGGKDILIEKYGKMGYVLDYPFDSMTIAMYNFVLRRVGSLEEDMDLYYGHLNNLGYFIAGDEIDGDMRDASEEEVYKFYESH